MESGFASKRSAAGSNPASTSTPSPGRVVFPRVSAPKTFGQLWNRHWFDYSDVSRDPFAAQHCAVPDAQTWELEDAGFSILGHARAVLRAGNAELLHQVWRSGDQTTLAEVAGAFPVELVSLFDDGRIVLTAELSPERRDRMLLAPVTRDRSSDGLSQVRIPGSFADVWERHRARIAAVGRAPVRIEDMRGHFATRLRRADLMAPRVREQIGLGVVITVAAFAAVQAAVGPERYYALRPVWAFLLVSSVSAMALNLFATLWIAPMLLRLRPTGKLPNAHELLARAEEVPKGSLPRDRELPPTPPIERLANVLLLLTMRHHAPFRLDVGAKVGPIYFDRAPPDPMTLPAALIEAVAERLAFMARDAGDGSVGLISLATPHATSSFAVQSRSGAGGKRRMIVSMLPRSGRGEAHAGIDEIAACLRVAQAAGDESEAERARSALRRFAHPRASRCLADAMGQSAAAALEREDLESAARLAAEALVLAEDDPLLRPQALGLVGDIDVRRGKMSRAERYAQLAEALDASLGASCPIALGWKAGDLVALAESDRAFASEQWAAIRSSFVVAFGDHDAIADRLDELS